MLITGFGGEAPEILQYIAQILKFLLNHYKKLLFPMGNFDFPKVWWGGNTDWWGGGQLPPLAPMVATALRIDAPIQTTHTISSIT